MKRIFLSLAAIPAMILNSCATAEDDFHMARYRDGIPGDKTIAAARALDIQVPVMAREWHLWWAAPHSGRWWFHWKGQRIHGQFDPATTIEQTIPGSSWRRWLNCTGYPLLGPYDSAQPDIIRWQLETARSAGLECLHIHLWPSLWDEGADHTPLPIFETILDTAAALKYPVAVHDEIMFRRPNITKAQSLESSIRRTTMLLKRYGGHPGFYKIDGMPVYYFQNWTNWIKPKELAEYLDRVEQEVGPVFWMVEMGPNEDVYKIPQIKCVLGPNNSWFLHVPPHGVAPQPWDELLKQMDQAAQLARRHGKKFGMLVYSRFNNNNDRGAPGRGVIPAEDGMFLVDSLRKCMKFTPDYFILTQWNDFEESGFIEPAWDFDGFNGDPYRYCRIVAAAQGKSFVPAPLPERDQLDPYIRHRLFGDTKPGDMGPVAQQPKLIGKELNVTWTDGPKPSEVRMIQKELATWTPKAISYSSEKLRLGNWHAVGKEGQIVGNTELRFYAPALREASPQTFWLGIRVKCPAGTHLEVNYRGPLENYRNDSFWKRRSACLDTGLTFADDSGHKCYWTPLHSAQFAGDEGDLRITLTGKKEASLLAEILIWSPSMMEASVSPANTMVLPDGIDPAQSLVAVPYDDVGNPGPPILLLKP